MMARYEMVHTIAGTLEVAEVDPGFCFTLFTLGLLGSDQLTLLSVLW
jgi:hypothetical protein